MYLLYTRKAAVVSSLTCLDFCKIGIRRIKEKHQIYLFIIPLLFFDSTVLNQVMTPNDQFTTKRMLSEVENVTSGENSVIAAKSIYIFLI